jgi:hypothetical protein
MRPLVAVVVGWLMAHPEMDKTRSYDAVGVFATKKISSSRGFVVLLLHPEEVQLLILFKSLNVKEICMKNAAGCRL